MSIIRVWRCALTVLLVSGCLAPWSIARAEFVRQELTKVPVERVLANLEDRAAEKPKDAAIKFHLARAYAMSYALKADEVEMKGKDIWYGYDPMHVPFENKKSDDKTKNALAEKRLAKAIETYEAALKLDAENIVGRLGYGWCLDQAGQDKEAVAEYRTVIERAWKKEESAPAIGPGANPITIEASRYLKPHLDVTKDAAEIKRIDERLAKLLSLPREITPIAIPLDGDLSASDIEDRDAKIAFDVDGSGLKSQRWSWIKPNAGWLVYDKSQSGKIDSGLQLFGSVTFWMFWQNGYEALNVLDDNHDGQLRGKELAGLAIWHDANQNGISDKGEVRPLAEYDIVAVNCRHQIDHTRADKIEFSRNGVTFNDGSTRPTYDLRLLPKADAASKPSQARR